MLRNSATRSSVTIRGERRIRPLRRPPAASPAKSTPPPRSRRKDVCPLVWPGVWIGMPVRQQNRVHLTDRSPCSLDGTCQLVGPPGNPGVHQHHAVVDDDGVCVHVSDGDLNHAVDDFAHVVIVTCSGRGCAGPGGGRLRPAIARPAPAVPGERPPSRRARSSAWSSDDQHGRHAARNDRDASAHAAG